MITGARSNEGILEITTDLPDSKSSIVAGVAISETGAVHIVDGVPVFFVNGLGVNELGQLCVDILGVLDEYALGYPFNSVGSLVIQTNIDPDPFDAYVGGLRVDMNGVFCVDHNVDLLVDAAGSFLIDNAGNNLTS